MIKKTLIAIVLFIIGFLSHYLTHSHFNFYEDKEVRAGEYGFVNPLLECDIDHEISQEKIADLKRDLISEFNIKYPDSNTAFILEI